ncbi:hypothetical protein NMG60_11028997 [Bertholletia excelsa]
MIHDRYTELDFSTSQLEFLAEDEMIEIVPNMRMDPLNLIRIFGDFGLFHPQIATQVPLWLAVALKKRGKCIIRASEWMSVVLEAEQDSQRSFQPLPSLCRNLKDLVRSLIEDITDVRFHKIGTGLELLCHIFPSIVRHCHCPKHSLKLLLSMLGSQTRRMEVNIVRPFVVGALQTFYKLDSPEIMQESDTRTNRQFPAANHGPRVSLPHHKSFKICMVVIKISRL